MLDFTPFTPFPILETPRLVLREIVPGDAAAVLALLGDPQVALTTDADPFTNRSEAEDLIAFLARRYANKQSLRWAITRKGDNRLVGTAGFNYFDERSRRAEIGYDLERALWGQGIATDAVAAILRFGFARLLVNRIEATTNLFNVASIKVLHKLGFTEEDILHGYGFWRGEYHDLRMFGLVRQTWEHLQRDADA